MSASGKIQPKRLVNISAETPGRVVDLAVNEGDRVKKGQFLLQIDPKSLRTRVDSGTASLQAAAGVARADAAGDRDGARAAGTGAQTERSKRQQDLWSQQLTTREALEKARRNDVQGGRVGAAGAREAGRRAGQPDQAGAGDARKRPLRPEQGPHRVADRRHRHAPQHPGGRNRGHRHDEQRRHRAADARRHVGDPGRSRGGRNQHPERAARADGEDHDRRAFPTGRSRGTSPRSATARFRRRPGRPARRRRRTSRSWSCSTSRCPTCGPGFTCTADITTATRKQVVAVPIPAVAVRELVYDAERPDRQGAARPTSAARPRVEPTAAAAELKPGQTRKETEGVFVVRDGTRRVRADQDGHRRRQVLRGAGGPQGAATR